jgi:hypothetical protein
VKQLHLSLELEAPSPPLLALERTTQVELVGQLAEAILAVHQKAEESTDERPAPEP